MNAPHHDELRSQRWKSARQSLIGRLSPLGLGLEKDYFFYGEGWQRRGIGVVLRDENLITVDFLLACSRALLESEDSEWGALISVYDPTRQNNMRAMIEVSNGLFTAISGGDVIRKKIFEAYHKMGLGNLLSWRP